jgi:hypothetical protein
MWLRCLNEYYVVLLSLVIFLAGCTSLRHPNEYKEEFFKFSKQTPSTPYRIYKGERLSSDKTAIIAVESHMMGSGKEIDKDKKGPEIVSINGYVMGDFMEDFDKPPKYYQLEILPGQNRLEIIVHWFNNKTLYYIDTNKLTFNEKAGAIYFLQIDDKSKQPNVILESLLFGTPEGWTFLFFTAPLWIPISMAVDSDDEYDDNELVPLCRFVWIWDEQTEQVVAGRAPKGWSNDQDSNTK